MSGESFGHVVKLSGDDRFTEHVRVIKSQIEAVGFNYGRETSGFCIYVRDLYKNNELPEKRLQVLRSIDFMFNAA